MNPLILIFEFSLLYLTAPLLIAVEWLPKAAIMPALWVVFLYTAIIMKRSRIKVFTLSFDRHQMGRLFLQMLVVTAGIGLFTWWQYPQQLFCLTDQNPWLWLAVIILYPLLSVIPQEVAFRRFFFYRYSALFGEGTVAILVNAALFGYVHIVFGNLLAVAFTVIGGLLFAYTYLKSRSILLVSVEHSVYGNTVYTFGLGKFFYHNGSFS